MSFTRRQWITDFLAAIGNKQPSATALLFVSGWSAFETPNDATDNYYNLLNTTDKEPGSTNYNSVGVQRFLFYADGIKANSRTIQNGRYSDLLKALQANDDKKLAKPTTAILNQLTVWCGGCGYGRGFVASGPAHIDDVFGYGDSSSIQTVPEVFPPLPVPGGSGGLVGSASSWLDIIPIIQRALDPLRWAKFVLGLLLISSGIGVIYFILIDKTADQVEAVTNTVLKLLSPLSIPGSLVEGRSVSPAAPAPPVTPTLPLSPPTPLLPAATPSPLLPAAPSGATVPVPPVVPAAPSGATVPLPTPASLDVASLSDKELRMLHRELQATYNVPGTSKQKRAALTALIIAIRQERERRLVAKRQAAAARAAAALAKPAAAAPPKTAHSVAFDPRTGFPPTKQTTQQALQAYRDSVAEQEDQANETENQPTVSPPGVYTIDDILSGKVPPPDEKE